MFRQRAYEIVILIIQSRGEFAPADAATRTQNAAVQIASIYPALAATDISLDGTGAARDARNPSEIAGFCVQRPHRRAWLHRDPWFARSVTAGTARQRRVTNTTPGSVSRPCWARVRGSFDWLLEEADLPPRASAIRRWKPVLHSTGPSSALRNESRAGSGSQHIGARNCHRRSLTCFLATLRCGSHASVGARGPPGRPRRID
jgi:hypothetical protein